MARGSIVKRCLICKKNNAKCNHKEITYSVVYRIGKLQKWENAGRNKKDAERKLSEIISQINNGTFIKPQDILFKDFTVKWLDEYARISVKPSTFQTYKIAINHHFIPSFGNFPLSYITTGKIQNFVSKSINSSSPKTVNNLITLLKTVFKYAKRWGYMRENPAMDIEHVRLEYREMDFLKPEEIQLLLKQAREPYKTLFLIAALTGMRRGEILALQWGDIDWHSNIIFVRRGIYWLPRKECIKDTIRWRFISPKSKRSIRAIVMSPRLKEALQIHRISSPVSPYELVFCNKDGKPFDPDNLIKRHFLPVLSFAGLKTVSFHSLRHSYTALLIAQGENIKFIQSQLGHSSIQTTLDRYGHLLPVNAIGVGERVDLQLFGSSANTVLTKHPEISQNISKQEQDESVVSISNK